MSLSVECVSRISGRPRILARQSVVGRLGREAVSSLSRTHAAGVRGFGACAAALGMARKPMAQGIPEASRQSRGQRSIDHSMGRAEAFVAMGSCQSVVLKQAVLLIQHSSKVEKRRKAPERKSAST